MIVVDASILGNALLYTDGRGDKARTILASDAEWVAPEHWKAELFSIIRGLTLGGKITEAWAARTLLRIPHLGIDHVSLDTLLFRMWHLRGNISGYDAAYVALAETRNLTLATADAKLARTAISYCGVELAS